VERLTLPSVVFLAVNDPSVTGALLQSLCGC
jgi:hypothetical protein